MKDFRLNLKHPLLINPYDWDIFFVVYIYLNSYFELKKKEKEKEAQNEATVSIRWFFHLDNMLFNGMADRMKKNRKM